MKINRILLVMLFISAGFFASAQLEIISPTCENLIDSSKKILYVGVFNHIAFEKPEDIDSIIVSSDPKFEFLKINSSKEGCMVNFQNRSITQDSIELIYKLFKNGQSVYQLIEKYQVLDFVSDWNARIGCLDSDSITVDQLLAQSKIICHLENTLLKHRFRISNYSLLIYRKQDTLLYELRSEIIGSGVKSVLATLETYDRIEVKYVKGIAYYYGDHSSYHAHLYFSGNKYIITKPADDEKAKSSHEEDTLLHKADSENRLYSPHPWYKVKGLEKDTISKDQLINLECFTIHHQKESVDTLCFILGFDLLIITEGDTFIYYLEGNWYDNEITDPVSGDLLYEATNGLDYHFNGLSKNDEVFFFCIYGFCYSSKENENLEYPVLIKYVIR